MKMWVDKNPFERAATARPPCGTTACIAGWALILSGKRLRPLVNYTEQGQKILGLTQTEAQKLFMVDRWPEEFQKEYDEDAESCLSSGVPSEDVRKNARVVVSRIDHFIKTGE